MVIMKRTTTLLCIAIMSSSLVLAGCQTAGKKSSVNHSTTHKTTSHKATAEGAVGGVLFGALIGGLIGGSKGALIGAAAGGLVGGVVGHEIDNRKKKYASTEAFYDGQLAQTKSLNVALVKNNNNLRASIQKDKKRINVLVASYKKDKTKKAKLIAKKHEIDKKITSNKTRIASLNKELKFQQGVVKDMQASAKSKKNAKPLSAQVAVLQKEIADLNEMQDAMASQSATIGQYM